MQQIGFQPIIQEILEQEGIKKFTDIQRKAIPFLFTEKNLVVVAPSGSGKTLIAELIATNDFIESVEDFTDISFSELEGYTKAQKQKIKKKATTTAKTIFLVPLRALADEKANRMARVYRKLGLKVHLSISEIDFNEEEIRKAHIIISTFERFRTILGRLSTILSYVKNVIIDEFHLLGDNQRGPALETILTTIQGKARLVLLSATVANPKDVARWLDAKLLYSEKRFLPLKYQLRTTLREDKVIKQIIQDNVPFDSQVLIFCGTRKKAEEYSAEYADFIGTICKKSKKFKPEKITAFLESYSLPKESIGNKQLFQLVQNGTAYHHAGLSRIAQKAIEVLFKQNRIKVLFCTETLGAGVNLPAREVIILETKRWNNEWLSRNVFHQIAGRAGRPGFDSQGTCTIIASDRREEKAIYERFWQETNTNYSEMLPANKAQFELISSKVTSADELQKMILTLIHSGKRTFEELIIALQQSYLQFQMKQKYPTLDEHFSEYFRSLLVLSADSSNSFLQTLELFYPTKGLELTQEYSSQHSTIFVVTQRKRQFTIQLTSDYGVLCSCQEKDFLCEHKLFVFQQFPENTVEKILNRNFALLEKLYQEKYIIENSKGILSTTPKGGVCAEMGVTVKRFEFLKDWLMYDLFDKNPSLTQLLFECMKILEYTFDREGFVFDVSFKRPIYEHVILGYDLLRVLVKYGLYEGDVLRLEMQLKSLITGITPLADFLGLKHLSADLQGLDSMLTQVIKQSF